MPKIMYKNVPYGNAPMQKLEITQAEYDALSQADKMKDILYLITDGQSVRNVTADEVSYGDSNVEDELDKLNSVVIKSKGVVIPSITIGQYGYTSIQSYMPSGMNHFLFCLVGTYSNSQKYVAFDVNTDGDYIRGTAGDTITYLKIVYYYTD